MFLNRGGLVAVSALALGCTFYSQCPSGTQGTGGTPGTAGTGNPSTAGTTSAGGGGSSGLVTGEPPEGEWEGLGEDLCGITMLAVHPEEDKFIAGFFQEGLSESDDGGETWNPLGEGEGSARIVHHATSILFDPADPDIFWEAGIYGSSSGVFRTNDGGETFEVVGLFHNDAVSVDFTDEDRRVMFVTGHEVQEIHRSTDGGKSFTNIGPNVPQGIKVCSAPLVLDGDTFLLGCGGGYDAGRPAILRSTDSGENWEVVHTGGGARAPLVASDGSIYWSDEFGGGLARSVDEGETWERVTAQTLMTVTPVELPDGRIASLTRENVVVSDDNGATWKKASPALPFQPEGLVYSPFQKAFYVWFRDCPLLQEPRPDPLLRFAFDYESD